MRGRNWGRKGMCAADFRARARHAGAVDRRRRRTHIREQFAACLTGMRRRSAPLRAWRLTRSGTLDPNPMGFITTAGIFASTVPAGSILLTTRLDTGLAHYLITPDTGNASQSALHLAHAVAARADEVDELPALDDVQNVAWMTTEKMPALISRDTQSGTDPAAVARALAISMRPGQWVAAALRAPTPKERRWALTWLESQMNTANPKYHSRRSEALGRVW